MKCDVATDLIIDSLMDDLGADESEQFQEHLASCKGCAEEATRTRALWRSLGPLGDIPVDPAASVEFGRRLERRTRRWWTTARIAAAMVGLLVTGAVLGRFTAGGGANGGVEPATPEFLLLIRGNEPNQLLPEAQLTQEYRAWAEELAGRGTLVVAEKLDDEGRWLDAAERPPDDLQSSVVSGFFIIRAAGYDEAVAIARLSPHIRYGGTIEVRALDRGQ